jgi:predicted RNA-binding Zn-ribbon protein involved in translation (DUF1610 family)
LAILAADTWIKSTWQFALEYEITIWDDLPEFKPLREFDQLLIPTFYHLGYRGNDLQRLNQCRLFLRVTWLSELITGDGKQFERNAVKHPYTLNIKEQYLYPNQTLPPTESWKIWDRALSRLCDFRGGLLSPLGKFLIHNAIQWWLDPQTDRLYYISDTIDMFRKAPGKGTRALHSKYIFSESITQIPEALTPVTVRRQGNTAYVTGKGTMDQENQLPPADDWILKRVEIPDNVETEWQEDIRAVSDGSFKDRHGTAAWILHVSDSCIIKGKCITPGDPECQSAFRSELAGLYGIAATVRYLERKYIKTGAITVACDGLSALQQAQRVHDFVNPNEPQYDLILAIRSIVADSSWQWTWRHVKGHQDDATEFQSLDFWGQWNSKMDSEAKRFWTESRGTLTDPQIYGEPWRTVLAGKKITSHLRERLREHCTLPAAKRYWQHKSRFVNRDIQLLDWEALGSALKATPTQRQHWVSKMLSGFCATGVMMKRRKERASNECPRCGEIEDVEHIWRCKHDTKLIWDKAMKNLEEWMRNNDTDPSLQKAVIQELNQWRSGDSATSRYTKPWFVTAQSSQEHFGWRNFFEGFIVKEWRDAITKYLGKIRSRRSAKRWLSALIRKQWLIAWDLWEHRNGYLHAKDSSVLIRELDEEIVQQFAIGTRDLDRNTKSLFQAGVQGILQKPMEIKRQWVKRIQVARDQANADDRDVYQKERRLLARWVGKQTRP